MTWKHPRSNAGRRSRSAPALVGVAVAVLATGAGLAGVGGGALAVSTGRQTETDRPGAHARIANPPTTMTDRSHVAPAGPAQTTSTAPVVAPVVASAVASPGTGTNDQETGAQVWRHIDFDLSRLPGWTVVFLPGRVGYRARTLPEVKRVEIYVRHGDTAPMVAYDLGHELGHAVDVTYSTPALRSSYRSIRGIPADARWFGCADCSDFATPAGDFAETFGFMVTDPDFNWRSVLGPAPTSEQIAAVTALYGL